MAKLAFLLFVAFGIMATTPGAADEVSDGIAALPGAVEDVRIGGSWQREGKSGVYRIVIARRGGYHGVTLLALRAMGTVLQLRRYLEPLSPGAVFVDSPYCYRCPVGQENEKSCKLECLEIAKHLIEYGSLDKVAGILMEPIQGPGGHIPAPKRYIKELKKWTSKNDIFLIWDESQLFTRIGHWFTSEYYDGLKPDITCLTKAIGGGLPMGVTIARKDLTGFNSAEEHSTFGANPLMFASGLVFLNYVERANLLENTRKQGKYITKKLLELQKKSEYIGDIRCPGLMIGIELVMDRETKKPANTLVTDLIEIAKDEYGVIFGTSAPISSDSGSLYRNIVKIKPPLTITQEDSDLIVDVFEKALEEAIDYL